MIPVVPAREPPDFDGEVRQPGAGFLRTTPNPVAKGWARHDYWRKALDDLLVSYRFVCAYSGSWTKKNMREHSTLQDSSVDHFIPKSVDPRQAYEWANFRLSRARLNNRKGNHRDVLDPFGLPNRWFILDFSSYLMLPNPAISKTDQRRVRRTICRLGLNTDDYVQERVAVVKQYCIAGATLSTLETFWPFIASEMRAQDFEIVFRPSMETAFRANAGHC